MPDNAHKILDVYAHFNGGEAGTVLVSNHFIGVGRSRLWTAADLQTGLEEAHCKGWVEKADRGWRLTPAGLAETRKGARMAG